MSPGTHWAMITILRKKFRFDRGNVHTTPKGKDIEANETYMRYGGLLACRKFAGQQKRRSKNRGEFRERNPEIEKKQRQTGQRRVAA